MGECLKRDYVRTNFVKIHEGHVFCIDVDLTLNDPYIRVQSSILSVFMINKTHIVVQKPNVRQLNAKVCIC